MRSVSRGDTKNVCLLFNSLLPPGKTEKGERERRKNVSLFSKKTLSFSLSLSSKALSLSFFDMLCFGCRFVFFFLSFRALLFVLGEIIKRWSSLSLFSLPGEIGNHIQSLSLSLSLTKRAFWKTRSPSRMLRGTQKERGMIISEKEEIDASDINSRAKAGKKKMDWISSHRAEQQPQRVVVASKTKTHENKSVRVVCYLPSAPAGHASKIHSSSVALIYICVYILLDLFDKRVRNISARCCIRIRTNTSCDD